MKDTILENKIRKLLEAVSDSYPDFVDWGVSVVYNYGEEAGEILLKYLETHKEATTEDISDFDYENITTKFPALV